MSAVLQRPPSLAAPRRALGMVVAFLALLAGLAVGAPIVVPSASASPTVPIGPAFNCPPEGFLFQQPDDQLNGGFIQRVNLVGGGFTSDAYGIQINGAGYNLLDNYIYGTVNNRDSNLDGVIDTGPELVQGLVRVHSDNTEEYLGLPTGWPSNRVLRYQTGDVSSTGQYVTGTAQRILQVDLDPTSPTYFNFVREVDLTSPAGFVANPDWAFLGQQLYTVFSGDANDDGIVDGPNRLFRLNALAPNAANVQYTDVFGAPLTLNGAPWTGAAGFGAMYADNVNDFLYVSENGTGDIYRISVQTGEVVLFTTTNFPVGLNDGARCQFAPLNVDFGDAPEIGYGTLAVYNGPRHSVVPGIALGATTDFDADGVPNADASGDDATGTDDEDAFAPGAISLNSNGPALTVPITSTGTGGDPVTVAGWIDLNGNGSFTDAGERQFTTVPANSTSVNLAWGAANGASANTFARFRIYQGAVADPQPLGPAGNGEVEDYPVVLTGSYHVSKSASVPFGATVTPGQPIDYTITVTNDSSVALSASFIDPLGDVFDDATLSVAPSAGSIDGANVLNWSGTVPAGIGATTTVTYSVTVNGAFGNARLFNAVQGPGCPPGQTTAPCAHEALAGTYSVAKTADVPDGTTIAPGQIINYTITVTPTGAPGATGIPASFTDNLSNILDDATLITGPIASGGTGGIDPATNVLSWSGPLTVGTPITVTYGVRVNNALGDGFLENAVVGNGCATGTLTPPCAIEHYAGTYTIAKTSNPVSGTQRLPGQQVTYTITVTKTGAGAVTGATFTDNLAAVLDDATGPGNTIVASVGTATMVDATTLRWTGDFPAGNATATITYTVTVNGATQLGDGVLTNGVTGANCSPTAPGCFTTHPIRAWTVVKTANPPSGTQVSPGSQVAYRLTLTNTGGTVITDASLTDSLAGVLDDATLTAGPTASSGTAGVSGGNTLTWSSPSFSPDQVVTIDYTVTLDAYADLGDGLLNNVVLAPEAGCPAQPVGPTCATNHTTPTVTITKTANAPTPTIQGSTVTYTITLTNTGTANVPSITVNDDLSQVLDDSTFQGNPSANVGSANRNGNALTWTGPVAPGTPSVITYSVVVNAASDLNDGVLRNAATSPGTQCCPPVITPIEAWTYDKSSAPASGTVVKPGAPITYTLTIRNTGGLALTNKTVVDDMSDVLDDASLTVSPVASSGTATFSDPTDTITWVGNLALDQVVTVTYTVTVRPAYQIGDGVVGNHATITDPSGECDGPPPCGITTHDVEAWDVLKESDATDVVPGDTVNYTITVTNKGSVVVDDASFTDDLTDVLDDATFDPDTLQADSGTVGFDAATSTITWTGDLALAQVVEITYTIEVNKPFSGDGHLDNAVFTQDGPCQSLTPIPERCQVLLPGKQLTIVKATDPVDLEYARPGDTVWYTVTITNSGELDYPTLAGDIASFDDDLSGVLDDADGPTPAQITVTGPGSATFDEVTGILHWTGPLVVDQVAVVRYAITVHDDITGDAVLLNVVTSETPGSLCPNPPVTDPEAPGYDPDCVSELPEQAYEVAKTSDPADGSIVQPGDRVTYTVTITSTGEADYPTLTVSDDMADVLDDATLDGAPQASAGSASVSGTTLTWQGALPAGEVVTVTYSVIVKPPTALANAHLGNVVTGSENFKCKPTVDQDEQCETHHDVAAYTTLKEVVSPVAPRPGEQVTYRITITSVGAAPIVGETISDDLTGVLDDAVWDGTASYSAGNPATVGGLSFTSPTLSWTGDIALDDVLVITYSVTLNPQISGDGWLRNVVSSNDCPYIAAMGSPLAFASAEMPPNCKTDTPIPSVKFTKAVSPAGPFKPGDVVTYTITATNTGEVDVDKVTWTDDMTRVLDDADMNGQPSSDRGAASFSTPIVNWAGSLAVGEVAHITYQVTIRADRGDGNMPNGVVGVGPGSNCPTVGAAVECQTLVLVLPAGVDLDPTEPGELPRTGGNTSGMVIIGSMLLAAGVGLIAVRRRRRSITS